MSFLKFVPDSNENEVFAQILLGGEYENFILNLKDWSKEDYIFQWKHAIENSLKNREVSALMQNYEKAYDHVKAIRIYSIIPEEFTAGEIGITSDESKDFYITESFIFITENEKTFTNDIHFNKIKKAYGRFFPIFYFDKQRMDKFYLYLSDRVEGISSWKVTAKDLQGALDL